jgi:hypothetical protein
LSTHLPCTPCYMPLLRPLKLYPHLPHPYLHRCFKIPHPRCRTASLSHLLPQHYQQPLLRLQRCPHVRHVPLTVPQPSLCFRLCCLCICQRSLHLLLLERHLLLLSRCMRSFTAVGELHLCQVRLHLHT